MDNYKIESSVEITDEKVEKKELEEGEVSITTEYKDGQLVESSIEGFAEEMGAIGEEMLKTQEELAKMNNLEDFISKSNDLSEEEKEIAKSAVKDGNFDISKLLSGSINHMLIQGFKDENKFALLLPHFYTTDSEEIKIVTPDLDIDIDDRTYYLKDEFKKVALTGKGDEEYTYYLPDYMAMHSKLEGIEYLKDNIKKLDIFVEYLGILQEKDKQLIEEYGKELTEKAYITAIDNIFDPLLSVEDGRYTNGFFDLDKKIKQRDVNSLKGFFFQRMFKKNKQLDLPRAFSDLLDSIVGLYVLSWERTKLGVDKPIEDHIMDILNHRYVEKKNTVINLNYNMISYLLNTFKNLDNRWAFVSLEKQIVETTTENCYLFEKFNQINTVGELNTNKENVEIIEPEDKDITNV